MQSVEKHISFRSYLTHNDKKALTLTLHSICSVNNSNRLQGHFCGGFFFSEIFFYNLFCIFFCNFEQCDTVVYALCPLYTAMTIMPTLADANDTPFLSYSLLLTSALDKLDQIRSN